MVVANNKMQHMCCSCNCALMNDLHFTVPVSLILLNLAQSTFTLFLICQMKIHEVYCNIVELPSFFEDYNHGFLDLEHLLLWHS